MNVLIAAVGYTNLRDLSAGPSLLPRLREMKWPAGVEIDDWSFGPIMVVQRLQDRPGHYGRIVFVSSVDRGREPGGIYCYRWNGELPDKDEIQLRVGEAVTGVISLDNLLIVTQQFDVLPRDVIVVETEPEDTGWGPGFSPRVDAAMEAMAITVRQVALNGYGE